MRSFALFPPNEIISTLNCSTVRRRLAYLIVEYRKPESSFAFWKFDNLRFRTPHRQSGQRFQRTRFQFGQAGIGVNGAGRGQRTVRLRFNQSIRRRYQIVQTSPEDTLRENTKTQQIKRWSRLKNRYHGFVFTYSGSESRFFLRRIDNLDRHVHQITRAHKTEIFWKLFQRFHHFRVIHVQQSMPVDLRKTPSC